MPFQVLLTNDALRDLEDLYDYMDRNDVSGKADLVVFQIRQAVASLSENPERGAFPREFLAIGLQEYREILYKPYRIIYRISGKTIYVYLIADGRRDMRTLLYRRLLKL